MTPGPAKGRLVYCTVYSVFAAPAPGFARAANAEQTFFGHCPRQNINLCFSSRSMNLHSGPRHSPAYTGA